MLSVGLSVTRRAGEPGHTFRQHLIGLVAEATRSDPCPRLRSNSPRRQPTLPRSVVLGSGPLCRSLRPAAKSSPVVPAVRPPVRAVGFLLQVWLKYSSRRNFETLPFISGRHLTPLTIRLDSRSSAHRRNSQASSATYYPRRLMAKTSRC